MLPSEKRSRLLVVQRPEWCPLQVGPRLKSSKLSTTTSKRRESRRFWPGWRSSSLASTFVLTLPPASRQNLAAADSRANPRFPQHSYCGARCAMVAKDVQETATSATAHSRRQGEGGGGAREGGEKVASQNVSPLLLGNWRTVRLPWDRLGTASELVLVL